MSDYGRFAFEPLLNLVSGRPVGVEVCRFQSRDQAETVSRNAVWGTRQLAEFDSGIAIASVLHADTYDATLPLHVDVLADTVVAARPRLMQLRSSLTARTPDRPAPPILIEIAPALQAAPAAALVEGTAALRAAGFGIGFDGAGRGFGLDVIAAVAPDLVKIERPLVARLPHDPMARTVVGALLDVCRAAGVRAAAVGVATRDELAAVRDHGIVWAQGPLLAPAQRRPTTTGVVLPVDLMPRLQASATRRPSPTPDHSDTPILPQVGELMQPAVTLREDATADHVRQAFADNQQAGSVVLLDVAGRPTGFLDRNRFMIAISGPFGRALYANRPARALAEPPRTLAAHVDVRNALQYCLSGDRVRNYDDVVLVDADASCAGVVRMADLLQEATGAGAASLV